MAENVWILGIYMTNFGKHKDSDVLDLGSEAAFGALADAGVSIKDIGVIATVLAGQVTLTADTHDPDWK